MQTLIQWLVGFGLVSLFLGHFVTRAVGAYLRRTYIPEEPENPP